MIVYTSTAKIVHNLHPFHPTKECGGYLSAKEGDKVQLPR